MKLNYRDKMILIVVFVLLIIVAGFMLFIKPAIDECSQASSDLESAKVQLSELEDQVDKDKNLAAEIQTLYTSTNTGGCILLTGSTETASTAFT